MDEEKVIQELLKGAFAQLREHTVFELMEKDQSYKESSARREEAERRYKELKEHLPEKITEVMEDYLEVIDLNSTDENDLHYLAGVMDTVRILASYGRLK